MKTVCIFGAGASKLAGAPLMTEFLDKAEELHRRKIKGITEAKAEFEDVLDALSELQAVYAKSYLSTDNIETLFGAIEMAQILKKFGQRTPEKITGLKSSIITLIVKTIEHSMEFPHDEYRVSPPEPYNNFGAMLKRVKDHYLDRVPASFLSFNYDLGLDYALHFYGIPFDYCLSGSGSANGSPYLKLHGSINWGACQKCKMIVPWGVGEARFGPFFDKGHVIFDLGTNIDRKQHCLDPLLTPPVLVPPTWNKTEYHQGLSQVWAKAAEELAAAETIIIIGYSLPETDSFFRYLFALGTEGATRIKRFLVINPDNEYKNEGKVEERFRSIIGRGIEHRCEFKRQKFEDSIDLIEKELMKP